MLAHPAIALAAVISGVSAHVFVFRIGEWDVASPSIFVFYFVAFLTGVLLSNVQFQIPVAEVTKFAGYHILGLYLSMIIYRAFLHRLSRYPGPFLARLSNFYITARSVKRWHLFEEVQSLHREYGDYVRLGPSELSIADPEAVKFIYGSQSPVSKGPWYTLLEPRIPLFMARDKQEHARRRKVWDQGFTTKALLAYDSRITKAVNQLLHVLEERRNEPINITDWFTFFVFDVMEDLAFNKSANMLVDGKAAYALSTIRTDMYSLAFFSHLPWLLPFLKRTPFLNREYLKFWDWIQDKIDERIKNEPDQPDIFSSLLAAYEQGAKTQRDWWNLHGDVQLIVVAGSDNVASTLTHLFFQLSQDLDLVRLLQKELDALPGLTHDSLQTVELLDAVIYETLRLHPAVPSGTQRVTPPDGLRIGNKHIPGNVIVQVPSYTVFRDPRAFEHPLDFIPERWTTRPELIKDKSVFIPFNLGPYGCVGKRLAMMEMRRLVGEILSQYDFTTSPEHSKEAFLDGKEDTFTLVPAPLMLSFTERVRKVPTTKT
ncbi:putative cytochrome P450 oxidoreductase [Nemania serpens]|nr:putative cytochrome P450 oxidoreductase [Nemania serpens]